VFDTVGNFGFNLIVTTRINNTESNVYLVAANGQVSAPLVTLNTLLEGPAIAPANFGTISQGDLVVADQHRGRVLDVNPTGNVSTFASGFIVPEGVDFIPQQVCAFYNAEEQNNLSPTPSLVKFYDASFFAGHEGQMLVRSELDPANTGNNIYAVDTNGNATILGKAQDQQEGAGFVSSCGMSCVSQNSSNFNGNPIRSGNYIWFNANFTVSGLSQNTTTTIVFENPTIQFSANNQNYNLAVPNALITFSPTALCSTTLFNAALNRWETIVPTSGSDEIFLSGLSYPVPADLPGGINPVLWQGTFLSSTPGLSIKWKWGAAVFTSFSKDHGSLGVKSTHNQSCNYNNGDHAGTPESFSGYAVGGARGGGAENTTGSWSGTLKITPCPEP
jgi:hypothetical protein